MVRRHKSSQYPHVYWRKDVNKWEARIKSLNVSLGMHSTEEGAHMAVEEYLDKNVYP